MNIPLGSLVILGSSVASAPLGATRVIIGTLLLLFGIRGLRKAILHRALAPVPGNAFTLVVGVTVSALGLYWFGEGVGIAWPLGDATIPALVLVLLVASMAGVRLARRGTIA